MKKTHLLNEDSTRETLLNGAQKLYDAVSVTMGPRGRNVIIRKAGRKAGLTHDGVTVAKSVSLDNPTEDVAADLLKEGAEKLDATTGDGTTTVTVLTYHLLKAAAEEIQTSGKNAMVIKRELDAECETVIKELKMFVKEKVDVSDVINVATVAAGDKAIGAEVGQAIFDAGADTPVSLGFSNANDTYSELIKGFKIPSGSASPYLMEGSGMRREMENVHIIVIDDTLRSKDDILPLLRVIAELPNDDRQILIVAKDIVTDAMNLVVINNLRGLAGIAVTKVPADIQRSSDYLADLAITCGATVLSLNTGHSVTDPSVDDFGRAEKVVVESTDTVIINGAGSEEDLRTYRDELEKQTKSKEKGVRDFATSRLQTLSQTVLTINVGGQSESEAEERHYRYEDAIGAARAALRGGVVAGGGTLLFILSERTNGPLKQALQAPIAMVYENAGITPAAEDTFKIGHGYDVLRPEDGVVDLVARGIIDPAESEIEAIRTAVSIAGLLLTAGAMVVEEIIDESGTATLPSVG